MKYTILITLVLVLCGCGQSREERERQRKIDEYYRAEVARIRSAQADELATEARFEEEKSKNEEQERKEKAEATISTATNFITWVKAGKKELCDHIIYPLYREYPIPPIANKDEFLKRYDEIFDKTLIKMIVNSDPTSDWAEVGWRGIMLHNGDIWLGDNGMLMSINYQSEYEARKRREIISADKAMLHESLKVFEDPIFVMETDTYRIRVDNLGNDNYRYASWKIGSSMNEKPDLVITNGTRRIEGSIGNVGYIFIDDGHLYECWRWRDSRNPATLLVYKDAKVVDDGEVVGTEILHQDAKSYSGE